MTELGEGKSVSHFIC